MAVTLRELHDRIRELELFKYRKKQKRAESESDADTKSAVEWADKRISEIRDEISRMGGK